MAAVDRAVHELRELILSGDLAAGERLGEVELAEELRMSRTPVREALRRLAAEGLVEVAANRGARVTTWSDAELEYVFELRARLEGLSARDAAGKATPDQLDALQDLAEKIAELAEPGQELDLAQISDYNQQFHGMLLAVAGSTTLATSLAGLVHATVLTRTQQSFDDAAMARSVNHHREIVAALRAGDPDWAESTMRSHLLSARASLLGPRRRVAPAGAESAGSAPEGSAPEGPGGGRR
jgi:DNA-binding GntR family transcriptional regulator